MPRVLRSRTSIRSCLCTHAGIADPILRAWILAGTCNGSPPGAGARKPVVGPASDIHPPGQERSPWRCRSWSFDGGHPVRIMVRAPIGAMFGDFCTRCGNGQRRSARRLCSRWIIRIRGACRLLTRDGAVDGFGCGPSGRALRWPCRFARRDAHPLPFYFVRFPYGAPRSLISL